MSYCRSIDKDIAICYNLVHACIFLDTIFPKFMIIHSNFRLQFQIHTIKFKLENTFKMLLMFCLLTTNMYKYFTQRLSVLKCVNQFHIKGINKLMRLFT